MPRPDFAAVPHGTLPAGTTLTVDGLAATITEAGLTAYRVEATVEGELCARWVPFTCIHGPYQPVEPLVVFS